MNRSVTVEDAVSGDAHLLDVRENEGILVLRPEAFFSATRRGLL